MIGWYKMLVGVSLKGSVVFTDLWTEANTHPIHQLGAVLVALYIVLDGLSDVEDARN